MDNAVTLRLLLIKDEDIGIHYGIPKLVELCAKPPLKNGPKKEKNGRKVLLPVPFFCKFEKIFYSN